MKYSKYSKIQNEKSTDFESEEGLKQEYVLISVMFTELISHDLFLYTYIYNKFVQSNPFSIYSVIAFYSLTAIYYTRILIS